jgi:aspartate/glutamate racemase
VVDAAMALTHQHPCIRRIVLECTNMAPFADDIRAVTGLPTLDIMDLVESSWKKL